MDSKTIADFCSAVGSVATALALIYVIKQNKASKIQQFESTFFTLIDLHNKIVSDLDYSDFRNFNYKGRDVFGAAKLEIEQNICKNSSTVSDDSGGFYPVFNPATTINEARDMIFDNYVERYYIKFEENLNHYFRNLYHILKYVYDSELVNDHQKQEYTSLLRAQLSQNELFAWLFNAMHSDYGYPNALFLIKEFRMMQNFRHQRMGNLCYWEYFNELMENLSIPEKFKKKKFFGLY